MDISVSNSHLYLVRSLGAVTPTWVLIFVRLLLSQLLHLLHRHIMLVTADILFTVASELGLPLSLASLCFLQAIGFVMLDVLVSVFAV